MLIETNVFESIGRI